MKQLVLKLYDDELGFVLCSELIIVATIAVLGLIVGLAETVFNINNELEDVGSAISGLNQNYSVDGIVGTKATWVGSVFSDVQDVGDGVGDILCTGGSSGEGAAP